MANLKEISKQAWSASEKPTSTEIQLGCIQRIADSFEVMAKDRVQLEKDLKWYKENYTKRGEIISMLEKELSASKGWQTRLKNKLKKAGL